MPDPIYTSIDIIPIDSKANGVCSLCGAFVLDYSLHTIFHRELVEAFAAHTRASRGWLPWDAPEESAVTKEIDR
jgi:hypothetical protein